MYFSLVMATLGRKEEIGRCLESLSKQTFRDFEVLIVDQNQDDRLDEMVSLYNDKIEIKHIKTKIKGLSRARNIGIKHSCGQIAAFPDDDCWYEDGSVLEKIAHIFQKSNINGLTIRAVDERHRPLQRKELSNNEFVTRKNVWNGGMSISIFIEMDMVNKVRGFDERIGVGAGTVYGAGEETDFLYRLLAVGASLYHVTDIEVCHPEKNDMLIEKELLSRFRSYGYGIGFVLQKNNASFLTKLSFLVRPLLGSFISLITGNKKMAYARIVGAYARFLGMKNK